MPKSLFSLAGVEISTLAMVMSLTTWEQLMTRSRTELKELREWLWIAATAAILEAIALSAFITTHVMGGCS